MKRLLALTAGLTLCGCTYFFTKVIPVGEPVTAERCKALDMFKIGQKDGQEGQRQGDKYDFWLNDCRSLGVTPDRALYNKGYDEGFKFYCSCEMGVSSAVHGEILGLKGQYFNCGKEPYQAFERGFALGEPLQKDESLVKAESVSKTTYFEQAIRERAKTECAKPPAPPPVATPAPEPKNEPLSPRPFQQFKDKDKSDGSESKP